METSLGAYGATANGYPAAPPSGFMNSLPKHVQQDLEIQKLCELYQQQLAELNACHSLLTVDQERLAGMLSPFVNRSGELVMQAPDPDVLLFKEGLDLRLKEFEEDCKRIQKTEERLQSLIDKATAEYEHAVQGIAMSTDSRIFKRLREQQRLVEVQQQEIDQIRFEKEMLAEETKRLREMTSRGRAARQRHAKEPTEMPRLHNMFEASRTAPLLEGTSDPVLFGTARRS
mmetsp:Transcript_100076/g.173741  ORF Transcript_100076/g.173741 Transcript_100076/m.173741 type:complete len:230 (+) Transcript_100076:47-736(+)